MSSASCSAENQSLIDKLKSLKKGDQIEVNCIDETLTVQSISVPVRYEVWLEASDGAEYALGETLLEDDVLEMDPRKPFSDPRIVRELEVVDQ